MPVGRVRQPMADVLVVLPGIMGSELEVDGRKVWSVSLEAVGNLLNLGTNAQRLTLTVDVGDNEPHDGVRATRLMPNLHLLPGVCWIDGYNNLVDFLRSCFTLNEPSEKSPGNFICFPYDWRLSNVVSARRLANAIVPELERWRQQTANPHAKLVFICHSMGGLVARWFLEVLGGREITRKLITIGTPYQGSVNALTALVNEFPKGLGPLQINLSQLVRSWPSMYQLLPTYPCIDLGDGAMHELTRIPIPHLDSRRVEAGIEFHKTMLRQIPEGGSSYEIVPVKGILQPTAQSALLTGERVESQSSYKGKDHGGDGTVPRPSAHPPEWADEGSAVFVSQKHGSLQKTDSVLSQLFGALTGNMGKWMGGRQVGLRVTELTSVGEPIRVEVAAECEDATLALHAIAEREDGSGACDPQLLRNEGGGRYSTLFTGLAPGPYRITVQSAVARRPVDPVTDVALVWDPALCQLPLGI